MNNKQYYVTLPDKAQEGPYDEETLIARYQAGKYLEGTLVWSDGMDGWIHIETIMSNAEKITNDVMRSADCKPNMPPLSVSIPPTPPTPSIPYNFKKEYYVADYDGNKQGPYSLDELKNSVKTGKLYGSELGWKQGMTDWVSLEDILDTRPVTYYMEPQSWVACSFFCASSILSIALTMAFSDRSRNTPPSAGIPDICPQLPESGFDWPRQWGCTFHESNMNHIIDKNKKYGLYMRHSYCF